MNKKNTRIDVPQVGIQKVNQVISDDYDRLNADNAKKAIQKLDLDELLIVSMHESRGKRRRSVIRAVLTKIQRNSEALKDIYRREAQKGFTILLFGQTGAGKSATINSLFDEPVAETNDSESQTKVVMPFPGKYRNVKYTIYDTPGLGELNFGDQDLDSKYLSCMKEECSSPDVLWYVLKLDNRLTKVDIEYLQLIHQNFGASIWDRTLLVWTHADALTQEQFRRIFDSRTETLNKGITHITDGKVQEVPSVAVANGHDYTPDGEMWLGELFTTSLERLNPERQGAFYLAFAEDLEIPKPLRPQPKNKEPENYSGAEVMERTEDRKKTKKKKTKKKKRIKLTKDQESRVEKTVDTSKFLTRGVMGIGMAIDVLTGGATLGIPTIVGGLIGGIGALIDWVAGE